MQANALHMREDLAKDFQELSVLREILRYVQILVSKRDQDDEEVDMMNEWRQVAQVMDRFFFLLFLTFTLTITLVMMVFIPYVNHYSRSQEHWLPSLEMLSFHSIIKISW